MGGSSGNLQEFYNSLSMYHNAWAQYFYQLQGLEFPGAFNPFQQFQGKGKLKKILIYFYVIQRR